MSKQKDKAQDEELKNEQETQEVENTEAPKAEKKEVKEEKKEKKAKKKTKQEEADEKLEEMGVKLQEMSDKYMRLSAEFDNYRKRTLKEKMDLMKSAGEKIFLDILPVMDNFERAIKAMETAKEVEPVVEGVNLIYVKFAEFLKQNGLEAIVTENADFDVDLHEAITKMPAPTEELRGKIIDCVEKGYKMNDKVVRYAKVVVGE